ncbi:MAG: hypothetical protein Q4B82_03550 [Alysiella sp.]|uniref:hypothetical protein n=1 Tax=Alysiella sp. TaxID=1872483 RepID=UPI0026DBC5D6|nr:hypothetical protein [Alysiella sp.]MDO4433638.1 hypothetical protein [Alysiella sp.]
MFLVDLKELSWHIDYDGFSWLLNESKWRFEENKAHYADNLGLTEDMLQMSYIHNDDLYVIDVGWYPDGDVNGNFCIVLIKNSDWVRPLAKYIVHYPDEVINTIKQLQDNGIK